MTRPVSTLHKVEQKQAGGEQPKGQHHSHLCQNHSAIFITTLLLNQYLPYNTVSQLYKKHKNMESVKKYLTKRHYSQMVSFKLLKISRFFEESSERTKNFQ